MRDLERYDIADNWPKLNAMRQEIGDLEARRGEAEAAGVAAREAIRTAQERDAEAASKAIRAGKSVPDAKHERKALVHIQNRCRVRRYSENHETSDLRPFTFGHRKRALGNRPTLQRRFRHAPSPDHPRQQ